MSVNRSFIHVKVMIIAPNVDLIAHAVSVNGPTPENTNGYHRLIGGSVEIGEVHRDAITREVQEELGARIEGLTYLAATSRRSRTFSGSTVRSATRSSSSTRAPSTLHRHSPTRR
jgi:ADP-ribose pyrophosphatase YjhB (NUDIX family)